MGSYITARYEVLGFPRFEDDIRTGLSNEGIWDNEVYRYSFVPGYKIQRSVLLKVAYLEQKIKNYNHDLEDYVLQSTLTILF